MQAVPKVSPPAAVAAVSRPSQGQVLDKIQAELAETKRREDELRRARREMFRSQPDLGKVTEDTASTETEEAADNQSDSDIEVRFTIQLLTVELCDWFIIRRTTLRLCCTPGESRPSFLSGRTEFSVRRRHNQEDIQ